MHVVALVVQWLERRHKDVMIPTTLPSPHVFTCVIGPFNVRDNPYKVTI
jgi:hypothetical protein